MSLKITTSPGMILKEYMDAQEMTQKELAKNVDSSEKHISMIINGKARVTPEFALKLEKVFQLKANFWLKIQSDYDLYLLRTSEMDLINLKDISKEFHFKEIFKGKNLSIEEQAFEMLNLLKIKNFNELNNDMNNIFASTMEDSGDKKAQFIWLKMCESEIEIQNNEEKVLNYSKENLVNKLSFLKKILYTCNFDTVLKNIRRFLNDNGIYFVAMDALKKSKIRGACLQYSNHPVIFLSKRYKRIDTFYFTLVHELSHIIDEDYLKSEYSVIFEEDEKKSNDFARNFFVNEDKYKQFIKKLRNKNSIVQEDIISFSKENKVVPDIVLGFLEHDKIIQDYSKYSFMKTKI